MRYSVIAAKDGDIYHDEVEAADQEEAERKAREQLAEAWEMEGELQRAIADHDVLGGFDAELDGFAVDPVPPTLAIAAIASTFSDAKDAPTSFEGEQWLEGFEDARCMIAHRLALALPEADRRAFLASAQIEPAQ